MVVRFPGFGALFEVPGRIAWSEPSSQPRAFVRIGIELFVEFAPAVARSLFATRLREAASRPYRPPRPAAPPPQTAARPASVERLLDRLARSMSPYPHRRDLHAQSLSTFETQRPSPRFSTSLQVLDAAAAVPQRSPELNWLSQTEVARERLRAPESRFNPDRVTVLPTVLRGARRIAERAPRS